LAVVIGTSGWQYDDWSDVLYAAVPRKRWLEHYANVFPTVEVNNTFYNLPKEQTFTGWAARTPDAFRFVCKASRYITHIRRVDDVADPVARFSERVRLLGEKLGAVLYQLPPNMERDDAKLVRFLETLPDSPKTALEFRNDSWYDPVVFTMLREHDVALVIADSPKHRSPIEVTASWSYVRLHGGPDEISYGADLVLWADRVAMLAEHTDPVWVFFDNDRAGNAVIDALSLTEKVRSRQVAVAPPPAA